MISARLTELGYPADSTPLVTLERFHAATRVGDLVFTSGHIPAVGDREIRGKVGSDVDLATAQEAAALCAVNCLRAVGAVADIDAIDRVVKVLGLVNVAPGFDQTPDVIHGCSELLAHVLGPIGIAHARSAIGVVLPYDWAVEVEMVVALAPSA
jgi:enamine deaminase RidA (YjgF/YER057c/UK114 family)